MQTTGDKSGNRIIRILIYLIPIFAILACYGGIIVVTQESYPFTIVTGTSMQPTIMPGTIAMIDKTPFNQLKVGDVIVFVPQIALGASCNSSPSSSLTSETPIPCYIIHRIVSITTNAQGEKIITTKGDNNQYSLLNGYDNDINSSMYIGQVVLQFPILGYATVPPYNEYLALLILIILAIQLLYDRNASRKDRAQTSYALPL
ncbi:MAG: signal peptidase I [Nitrososphaerota archaeon]|nr:signal peptidase I [Nitrososphaerota archaeon]